MSSARRRMPGRRAQLLGSFCLAVWACGGSGPTPPEPASVVILITTTGYDLDPDGYDLAIDAAAPQHVDLNVELELPNPSPGGHTIRLAGIAINCAVVGPNPLSVSVAPGETARAEFAVQCRSTAPPPEVHLDLRATAVAPRDTNRVVVSALPDARDSILSASLIITGYGARSITLPFRGRGLQTASVDFPIPVECISDVASIDYHVVPRVGDTVLRAAFTISDATPPEIQNPTTGSTPVRVGEGILQGYGVFDRSGLDVRVPSSAAPGDSVLVTVSAVDLCGNTSSGVVVRLFVVP